MVSCVAFPASFLGAFLIAFLGEIMPAGVPWGATGAVGTGAGVLLEEHAVRAAAAIAIAVMSVSFMWVGT